MRLELTEKTDLAKRALTFLASVDPSEPVRGGDLAGAISTTIPYLPQVMRPLVTSGWIASHPGPRGGYQLTAAGRRVTMLALIEAVEGPVIDGRCVLRSSPCPRLEPCALHDAWSRARGAMVAELGQLHVIGDEANNQGEKP